MADLITVHRDDEELLLNRDQIIFAVRGDATSTVITLRDNKTLVIKETLTVLRSKTS